MKTLSFSFIRTSFLALLGLLALNCDTPSDTGAPSETVDHESCRPPSPAAQEAKVKIGKHDVRMKYVSRQGMAIVGGDIALGPVNAKGEWTPPKNDSDRRSSLIGRGGDFATWENGIIPYAIETEKPFPQTDDGREFAVALRQAMDTWERAVNTKNQSKLIQFVPKPQTSTTSKETLDFTPTPGAAPYLAIRFNEGGCYVTMRGATHKGPLWMNLDTNCLQSSTILHELGHVLGLWHEHQRHDRDRYIDIKWCNVQLDQTHNFLIDTEYSAGIGPYDFCSIMHYGFSAFGKPSSSGKQLQTIAPRPGYEAVIGVARQFLSMTDILGVSCLYHPGLGRDSPECQPKEGALTDCKISDAIIVDATPSVTQLPAAPWHPISGFYFTYDRTTSPYQTLELCQAGRTEFIATTGTTNVSECTAGTP